MYYSSKRAVRLRHILIVCLIVLSFEAPLNRRPNLRQQSQLTSQFDALSAIQVLYSSSPLSLALCIVFTLLLLN